MGTKRITTINQILDRGLTFFPEVRLSPRMQCLHDCPPLDVLFSPLLTFFTQFFFLFLL